ncbi:MAG: hypothetical protein KJ936_06680 [Proteobacteria bacterium]|nr:hypothetical protein [Pseudomonadota bacterium]MBU2227339.1 hypothetical protein [Pseudomonadota bacterium]
MDDPTIRGFGLSGRTSDRRGLARGGGRFTILLQHQPFVETVIDLIPG